MAFEQIARVGDTASGVCNAHDDPVNWTGTIATGASNSTCNGQAIARVDDTGSTSCGHTFKIVAGSPTGHICEGKLIARRTDAVIVIQGGNGTITSGSPDAYCN